MQRKTVKLCICAVLAAMYVGLDLIAISLSAPFGGTMKFSVSGLPVIIAAVLFGPLWGGAVGFVGAFIGQVLSPYGITATTLLWVMPATIRGLVIGLLFILFKRSIKPYVLVIETVISSVIVTAVNTLAMYVDAKVYKYPVVLFGIGLVNRIAAGIVTAIIFAFIVPPIIVLIRKIVK